MTQMTQDAKFIRGQAVNVRQDDVCHKAKIRERWPDGRWSVWLAGRIVAVDEQDITAVEYGASSG